MKAEAKSLNPIQNYPLDLTAIALLNRRVSWLMEALPKHQKDTLTLGAKNLDNYFYYIQKCYDELFKLANPYEEQGLLERNYLATLPKSYIQEEPTIRTLIKLTQHIIEYFMANIDVDESLANDLASKSKDLAKYKNLPVLWNERFGNGTPKEQLSKYMKERSKFNVYEKYLPEILKQGVKYAHERGIQTLGVS